MSQRYPTQRRPLFGVVTELAGVWEPCGAAAEDESDSQQTWQGGFQNRLFMGQLFQLTCEIANHHCM
jgi:hypothetical protein